MDLNKAESQARASSMEDHYQCFYPIANASEAHSRFCERVYGKDLCQDGQADMACFDEIVDHLHLQPGDHVLDMGCGAGGLAAYLSDRTGARVTGVDNSATAIATAKARTTDKRERVAFVQADMNSLGFPDNTFDAVISIDSITWATDVVAVIASLVRCVKPGGQLRILMETHAPQRLDELKSNQTRVAVALSALHLDYVSHDYTASLLKFWPLARETAESLRGEFCRDGAEFLCDSWIRYADEIYLPAIRANQIRRYLYCVDV